jgi:hypothetical protein
MSGASLIATRRVDLDDKETVNEGKDDELAYRNDIGVEGYQKSNMVGAGRADLQYGILVRKIPAECTALVARVVDLGGNVSVGEVIAIPELSGVEATIDFEDGKMPPPGWQVRKSASADVTNEASSGSRRMRCSVSGGEDGARACLEHTLPIGRLEWSAEARCTPVDLDLAPGQSIRLLSLNGSGTSGVAARIYNVDGNLRAGLVARQPNGRLRTAVSNLAVASGVSRTWRLVLRRLGTRESTAILLVGGTERLRLDWDATLFDVEKVQVGITRLSGGATAVILADQVRLTESL